MRVAGAAASLERSPRLVTDFEFVNAVSLDVVNNCNLRCPFCLYDYANTRATRFMSEETLDAALRLIPHVNDGGFWLSCLHEPFLHPEFLSLLERVPRQWRHKVMFTTNLAKRMPEPFFVELAKSGVFHINISVESLTPSIYEKFRKGARWPIFKENWDRLITAWRAAEAPPRLRYIAMAYKSNFRELPDLVRYLHAERMASQVELRYTFAMSHIPAEFGAAEYLDEADWAWLRQQLAEYGPDDLMLNDPPYWAKPAPPATEPEAEVQTKPTPAEAIVPVRASVPPPPARLPELPLNLQVAWDGQTVVGEKWLDLSNQRLAVANIRDLARPFEWLVDLASAPVPDFVPDERDGPLVQGFIDRITADEIIGWIRDAQAPARKVAYEAVLPTEDGQRVLAAGIAGLEYADLGLSSFEDRDHGFVIQLSMPLSRAERAAIIVRDPETMTKLPRAPAYQGGVKKVSARHVAGWVRSRFEPEDEIEVEVALGRPGHFEVLWRGPATDEGALDGLQSFHIDLPRCLNEAEQALLAVRPVASPYMLDRDTNPVVAGRAEDL